MMRYAICMRTTLDLDEDVLSAAKELAAQQGVSTGKAVSELIRQALKPAKAPKFRNGFRLLEPKPDAKPVTMEWVNKIRDEE